MAQDLDSFNIDQTTTPFRERLERMIYIVAAMGYGQEHRIDILARLYKDLYNVPPP